ncbi:hypothetical protein AAFF_G00007390 [Aldrovandia affinis]|uniref:Uncharacterized protein n=1 Tax=Aldrovandia affinis TaxID=143900 RepID=A0AAD7T7L3_9TELE|nr:hypothetical protein AAFF_G00007390 [Aldrovandia affinis]
MRPDQVHVDMVEPLLRQLERLQRCLNVAVDFRMLIQSWTSFQRPCHTNLAATSRCEGFLPGCESLWMVSKTRNLQTSGTMAWLPGGDVAQEQGIGERDIGQLQACSVGLDYRVGGLVVG